MLQISYPRTKTLVVLSVMLDLPTQTARVRNELGETVFQSVHDPKIKKINGEEQGPHG